MASALRRGSISARLPLCHKGEVELSCSLLDGPERTRLLFQRPSNSRAVVQSVRQNPCHGGESRPLQATGWRRVLGPRRPGIWNELHLRQGLCFVVEQIGWTRRGGKQSFQRCMVCNCSSSSDSSPAAGAAAGNGRRPWPAVESRRRDAAWNGGRGSSSGERLEKFFATCSPGLEEVVAAELRSAAIGASRVQVGSAGVSFQGGKDVGVRANLWLRCATRVLLELASGPLPATRAPDPVYEFVRRAVDWPTLLVDKASVGSVQSDGSLQKEHPSRFGSSGRQDANSRDKSSRTWKFRTFLVTSRVWDCKSVNNSMFASVRAKDAICDAVKDACGGSRPNPPEESGGGADVPLFLSLYRDYAVLYRDMSGVSLHKRGYRDVMHRAGLNEAIAAAMLTMAGWNSGVLLSESWNRGLGSNPRILMDPMCGSGTLLIEAALMAINGAPGLMRSHWPFETWHDFHPSILTTCRKNAIADERSLPKGLRLLGNDIHEGALSLCMRDAKAANVLPMLELSCKDCRDYTPAVSPSIVTVNPPWGARLADGSSAKDDDGRPLLETWNDLGTFLKRHCSQADVYVLSGNSAVTRAMHMKADKKWPVSVGGTDCRIMHYHVLPPKQSTVIKPDEKVKRSHKESLVYERLHKFCL